MSTSPSAPSAAPHAAPEPSGLDGTATYRLQLQFTASVLRRNVGDVTHDESLRSFEPAGNGLNWVLGHLVATRSRFLAQMGGAPAWSDAECRPYDQHAPSPADRCPARPLAEIWDAFDRTQARLLELAGRLTPAELSAPLPPGELARTRGEALAVMGFHDAYHAGQTGLIRRLLGRPPADL